MLEAVIATALMAAVLAALATVTAQWLPSWNRGFAAVQRNELLALGLERLAADVAAAEFIPVGGDNLQPIFEGGANAIVLVRTALGPNTPVGLEIVRFAEVASERGPLLVRTRAPFMPAVTPTFSDPVVLLRPPYRVSFSYAAADRVWRSTWRDASLLPRAVRFQVRDGATERLLSVSTSTLVHSDIPPDCAAAQSIEQCLKKDRRPGAAAQAPATPPGATPRGEL